jgi:hypothetical protein
MFRALLAGALLAVSAGAAVAQPHPNATTTICLDVNGNMRAADCKAQASRLAPNTDVCLCREGVRAEASICPDGVQPPAESAALNNFRRQYLRNRHTLVDATFEGKPMCVLPRQAIY